MTGRARRRRHPCRCPPSWVAGSARWGTASTRSGDVPAPGAGGGASGRSSSAGAVGEADTAMPAPKVLISDALSPAAVQIFRDRGIDVTFDPNLGKD